MSKDVFNRKLSFLEKCFSLTNYFPNKRRLCFLGLSFYWDKTNPVKTIVKNRVVFWTSSDTFSCNPKYIALKLREHNPLADIYWVVSKNTDRGQFPHWVHLVYGTKEGMKILGTAKVIVCNERMIKWIKYGYQKQLGQYIIQTWHGSLGIKKTGDDRGDISQFAKNRNKFDSMNIDYICSNGDYCTTLYKRIFHSCGKIFETGLPRNDIFFNPTHSDIKKNLRIPTKSKVLLYAPTCRENRKVNDFCHIDFNLVIKTLNKKFGGSWVILYRKHYLSTLSLNNLDNFYDVSSVHDIQEIMNIADIVMTDYSSCIYDFVLSKRPGFIYAEDREEYEAGRGLYYSLSKTPFPIAQNQEELIKNIEDFDPVLYSQRVQRFLESKGVKEDGHASERMAKIITSCLDDKLEQIDDLAANKYS